MEEEAEILMCLWVDKPGICASSPSPPSQSCPKRSDVHATVLLQEVLPGVSAHLRRLHVQIAQNAEIRWWLTSRSVYRPTLPRPGAAS